MAVDTLTDAQIAELLACPKRVDNPGSKARTEGKHIRRDFRVTSTDERHGFVLFTRQSTIIPDSFSAGLRWKSKTGEEVILTRCNGADHPHGNALNASNLVHNTIFTVRLSVTSSPGARQSRSLNLPMRI